MAVGKMSEFHYTEGALKLNAAKELLPVAVHPKVDLVAGFLVTCPAKACVVLTSMEYSFSALSAKAAARGVLPLAEITA